VIFHSCGEYEIPKPKHYITYQNRKWDGVLALAYGPSRIFPLGELEVPKGPQVRLLLRHSKHPFDQSVLGHGCQVLVDCLGNLLSPRNQFSCGACRPPFRLGLAGLGDTQRPRPHNWNSRPVYPPAIDASSCTTLDCLRKEQ